jgi:hypothetical protein
LTPQQAVTPLKGDRAETAAFAGALAIELDERQHEKGFGPCLDAAVSGARIKVVMADSDELYPDWRQIAQRERVTHSLSVGIPVAAPTVGALNVYSSTVDRSPRIPSGSSEPSQASRGRPGQGRAAPRPCRPGGAAGRGRPVAGRHRPGQRRHHGPEPLLRRGSLPASRAHLTEPEPQAQPSRRAAGGQRRPAPGSERDDETTPVELILRSTGSALTDSPD